MNTLSLILQILALLAKVLQGIVFIDVIISWIQPLRDSVVGYFFHVLSEPILHPIRKLIERSPLGRSPLDFSPIFAFLLIDVAYRLLASLLIWAWPAA